MSLVTLLRSNDNCPSPYKWVYRKPTDIRAVPDHSPRRISFLVSIPPLAYTVKDLGRHSYYMKFSCEDRISSFKPCEAFEG